jgi:phosphonate transport system substrate-binding protein
MFLKLLIIIALSITLNANSISFTPLSTNKDKLYIRDYSPFLDFLSRKTDLKFEMLMVKDTKEFTKKLKKNKIDLMLVDALTYIRLKENIKHIEPIVAFRSRSGRIRSTCSIITTDKNITELSVLGNKRFVISDKVSSCGYLMSEHMLKKSGLSLNNIKYSYESNATDLVMSIILQEYDAGAIRTDIAKKYESMGIKFLAYSDEILGFILVANTKKIDTDKINTIKELLLDLDIKRDNHLIKRWGSSIKYGSAPIKDVDFNKIRAILKNIEIPK